MISLSILHFLQKIDDLFSNSYSSQILRPGHFDLLYALGCGHTNDVRVVSPSWNLFVPRLRKYIYFLTIVTGKHAWCAKRGQQPLLLHTSRRLLPPCAL